MKTVQQCRVNLSLHCQKNPNQLAGDNRRLEWLQCRDSTFAIVVFKILLHGKYVNSVLYGKNTKLGLWWKKHYYDPVCIAMCQKKMGIMPSLTGS